MALTDGSAGHHELAGEPLVRRRRAEADEVSEYAAPLTERAAAALFPF